MLEHKWSASVEADVDATFVIDIVILLTVLPSYERRWQVLRKRMASLDRSRSISLVVSSRKLNRHLDIYIVSACFIS